MKVLLNKFLSRVPSREAQTTLDDQLYEQIKREHVELNARLLEAEAALARRHELQK